MSNFLKKVISLFMPFLFISIGTIVHYIDFRILLFIYLLYCVFENINAETKLVYANTERNINILNKSKVLLKSKFKPHFLMPNPFLQLLAFPFMQQPEEELIFEKENVNEYGAYIEWVDFKLQKEKLMSEKKSILLLIPGLTGGAEDPYIVNTCYEGLKSNHIIAVYKNRLLSDTMKLYEDKHVDLFNDFEKGLELIKEKHPEKKIFAVGYSYGSNILVHYLGARNIKSKLISGGVSVSNPYDFIVCQKFLSETVYENLILKLLKNLLKKNYHLYSKPNKFLNLDIEKATHCKSSKEFDEYIIRRILGYKTADDYYRGISCVSHIHNVDVPLLCISALDDNITTSKAIPFDEISLNKNIFLLTTNRGGHLCWISNESLFSLNQWVNKPIIDFIDSLN
jgi:predicted alpha/beta-fold hydrolase